MTDTAHQWLRTSPRDPCPVCKHDSHCTVSPDGKVVRCKRVTSEYEAPGDDGDAWLHFRDGAAAPRTEPPMQKTNGVDWRAKAAAFTSIVTAEQVQEEANNLHVEAQALIELGIGFDEKTGVYTFPMYASDGSVCGIKVRTITGEKKAMQGGKLGVMRRQTPNDGQLLICEGESDTAAALSFGFDAMGTPGAGHCAEIVAAYAKDRDVVIVADNDKAGTDGAGKLLAAVRDVAKSVRLVFPPAQHKDLRAWRIAGATREDIDQLIAAAKPSSLGPIADAWATLPAGLLSTPPPVREFLLRWTTNEKGQPAPPRQGHGFTSAGIVGVLSAAGGVAKTWILLQLAVCIVLGRRFLGFDIGAEFVGRRCCLVLAEEKLVEVHRRLFRACEFLGISDADRRELESKLVILPLHGKRCGLISPGAAGALPTITPVLQQLRDRLCAAPEPWGIVALDPASRLLPGSEGSNDAATFAIQVVEELVEVPGNPLVMVSGHSSKTARRMGDVDARGVTGLTDGSRLHLTLKKKTDGTIEFAAPKSNYGADLDKPLILRKELGGVLRLVTDEEVQAQVDAAIATEEDQVMADAKAATDALAAAGSAKSVDAVCRLSKLGKRRGRPAVKFAMEEGWIVKEGSARDRVLCVCAVPPIPPGRRGADRPFANAPGAASDARTPGVDGASMGRRGVEADEDGGTAKMASASTVDVTVPDDGGTAADGRTASLDDGRAEQPGGSRPAPAPAPAGSSAARRSSPKLVKKNSKEAVHFMIPERLSFGDLPPAKKLTLTVACGYALDEGWNERTTCDGSKVTCRDCHRMAIRVLPEGPS